MTNTTKPDLSREAVERLAERIQSNSYGWCDIKDTNATMLLALLDRAEAAEKRLGDDMMRYLEMCAIADKLNAQLSEARASAAAADRQRDEQGYAAKAFQEEVMRCDAQLTEARAATAAAERERDRMKRLWNYQIEAREAVETQLTEAKASVAAAWDAGYAARDSDADNEARWGHYDKSINPYAAKEAAHG